MNIDQSINQLLLDEIANESDEVTKRICRLTVELAQEASSKGVPNIAEYVSRILDSKLNKIFKDLSHEN